MMKDNIITLVISVLNRIKQLAAVTALLCIVLEVIGFFMIYDTILSKIMWSIYMILMIAVLLIIAFGVDRCIAAIENKHNIN